MNMISIDLIEERRIIWWLLDVLCFVYSGLSWNRNTPQEAGSKTLSFVCHGSFYHSLQKLGQPLMMQFLTGGIRNLPQTIFGQALNMDD